MGMMISSFGNIMNVECLILILAGVAIGIFFGSIPGLSVNMAIILCLPLSLSLGTVPRTAVLIALYLGGISGGLISAILLKRPETASSSAICFDGVPMAEKGEAGKALGTGVLFSFLGSLFSIIILALLTPMLSVIQIFFTSFEQAALGIFSLTVVSCLIGKDVYKGVLAAFIGIVLSMVGSTPIDGSLRFTFGFEVLEYGFNVIVLMLGLFALGEVLSEAKASITVVKKEEPIKYDMKNFGLTKAEILSQKGNALKSAVIGTAIGILPGLGGSNANLKAYSAAKKRSKYPEKFGTGIVDGIVSSTTSNNATIGGALIPLLALGIPGDTVTAILLGGQALYGAYTGSFLNYGSVFASLFIANIFMLILMKTAMPAFAKLLNTPKKFLLPIVAVLCLAESFTINNSIFDVCCVIGFGLMGWIFKKAAIPRTPLIMGFILEPIMEISLKRVAVSTNGNMLLFFTRPIACLLMIASIIILLYSIIKPLIIKGKKPEIS